MQCKVCGKEMAAEGVCASCAAAEARDGGRISLYPMFFIVVPTVVIAYLLIEYRPERMGAMEIAGMAMAIVGIAMLTLARYQLGNSFSVTPQAKKLVTNGIYAYVRNPVYVFSAIALSGLVLYVDRPWLLLGLLVLIPAQVVRARAEGRVLEEKFGDEYRRYKAKTWM